MQQLKAEVSLPKHFERGRAGSQRMNFFAEQGLIKTIADYDGVFVAVVFHHTSRLKGALVMGK